MTGMSKMEFLAWNDKPTKGCLKKELLGGKGLGLFEMQKLGVPVPEFVVIPTTLCVEYMSKPAEAKMAVKKLAKEVTDRFVAELGFLPLLSVRSGARVSMPGMMDTILNVGMGDSMTADFVAKLPDRTRKDCSRRFLHMFGSTVFGLDDHVFEAIIMAAKSEFGAESDADLTADQLQEIADSYKGLIAAHGHKFPTKAREQIEACILAVMESWNSLRAIEYRKHNGIPDDWGTAVVIQRMVFGNMNDDSNSGVAFSRDPATGANNLIGEFLPNAQGEDVVAGIRTPLPLTDLPQKVLLDLGETSTKLEQHFRDMLDMEFTVEDGKLYMLQVRTAKRSARAWVRSTLDMVDEGLIDRKTAFERIKREHVRLLSRPVIDPKFKTKPHLTGIPACAGVVTGVAVFSAPAAVQMKEAGKDCILIRHETSPEDIAGMFAAVGIVTATGGTTSHAAVVARGMDKVCVTGCEKLSVTGGSVKIAADTGVHDVQVGMKVTVDGSTGRIWIDTDVPVSDPTDDPDLKRLAEFVEEGAGDTADVVLPLSPGSVYMATQFLGDVPPPTEKKIWVFDNGEEFAASDPLLTLTGDPSKETAKRMNAWASKHGVDMTVVKLVDKPSLNDLLDRPCTPQELEKALGGVDVDALRKLVAPAKLEDKFQFIGCQRHRLLAAFQ